MEPTRPERAPGGHARRRDALRDLMRGADLDALLVTDLVNVRYLTGFTGSNDQAADLGVVGHGEHRRTEHGTTSRRRADGENARPRPRPIP